jgi:hypothetical protein
VAVDLTAQPYPLWLAQVVDGEVQVGRVIAWTVGALSGASRDTDAVAQPIVVFADDNGFVWATMHAARTAPRFVCDSREAAETAAHEWVGNRRTADDRHAVEATT